MTEFELLGRIADLELALRAVVVVWIASVVLLMNTPDCQCHPRHVCPPSDDGLGSMCPLHRQPRNRCDRYHKDTP